MYKSIKVLCHHPFLNLHKIRHLGLSIHQGLISKSMQIQQSGQIKEKTIEFVVVKSGMKRESETILEVIRGLVLDFVFYFVTV